jgi:hypothetical protein
VTVNYATADGTATTSGSDYTAASGTLSFAPSAPTRTFTVAVQGDTVPESDETFVVNLSAATNAVIGDAQAIGTIVNDDGPAGPTVTATSSVSAGGTISVGVANGPANPTDWVALVERSAPDTAYVQWWYLNGSKTAPASGLANASLQFTAPSSPGTYDVRLFTNNSMNRIARSGAITVTSAGPAVSVSSTTVQRSAVINFEVSGGPANRLDWVSLSPASAPDSGYQDWNYLNGMKTAPATGQSSATLQFTAPSTPGTYNIRFFANNGMNKLATSATITVAP